MGSIAAASVVVLEVGKGAEGCTTTFTATGGMSIGLVLTVMMVIDGRTFSVVARLHNIVISWSSHGTANTTAPSCKVVAACAGVPKMGAIIMHGLAYTPTGGWGVVPVGSMLVWIPTIPITTLIILSAIQDQTSNGRCTTPSRTAVMLVMEVTATLEIRGRGAPVVIVTVKGGWWGRAARASRDVWRHFIIM